MNTELIEFENNFYNFKKRKFETHEIFMKRVWFVLKRLHTSDFDELINQSYIWANIKFLNCKYDSKIMNKYLI